MISIDSALSSLEGYLKGFVSEFKDKPFRTAALLVLTIMVIKYIVRSFREDT
jgi:hypothetical protein